MIKQRLTQAALAAAAAAAVSVSAMPRPAAAQSQGTINTVLGVAAAVGGIILYNNYVHKRQAANSVVGYTRNGGTVYGDGRIVFPNGATMYPNASGQYPSGGYAYYNPNANPNAYRYDPQRTGRWDETGRHHRGGYEYVYNNGNGKGHGYGRRKDHDDRGKHRGEHHDDER